MIGCQTWILHCNVLNIFCFTTNILELCPGMEFSYLQISWIFLRLYKNFVRWNQKYIYSMVKFPLIDVRPFSDWCPVDYEIFSLWLLGTDTTFICLWTPTTIAIIHFRLFFAQSWVDLLSVCSDQCASKVMKQTLFRFLVSLSVQLSLLWYSGTLVVPTSPDSRFTSSIQRHLWALSDSTTFCAMA